MLHFMWQADVYRNAKLVAKRLGVSYKLTMTGVGRLISPRMLEDMKPFFLSDEDVIQTLYSIVSHILPANALEGVNSFCITGLQPDADGHYQASSCV